MKASTLDIELSNYMYRTCTSHSENRFNVVCMFLCHTGGLMSLTLALFGVGEMCKCEVCRQHCEQ